MSAYRSHADALPAPDRRHRVGTHPTGSLRADAERRRAAGVTCTAAAIGGIATSCGRIVVGQPGTCAVDRVAIGICATCESDAASANHDAHAAHAADTTDSDDTSVGDDAS